MVANLEKAKLNAAEAANLKTLERTIENARGALLAMARALSEIRDGKLYRAEFSTFEEYCKVKWGFSKRRAYQLLEGAETVKSLPEKSEPLVHSERQARALALVPPEKRVEVLEEASKDGPVTAKKITEAAQKVEPEKPTQQLDKTGYPIPESILADWQHAESYSSLLREVSNIKKVVSDALEGSDIAFREISNTTVALIQNVYGQLKCIIPYAVCTSCQGHNRAKCTLCKRRGFISKFAWEQYVPSEIKKMRMKMKK
jgi:hypothetical protein